MHKSAKTKGVWETEVPVRSKVNVPVWGLGDEEPQLN